jgi:hypothetical protein
MDSSPRATSHERLPNNFDAPSRDGAIKEFCDAGTGKFFAGAK